MPQTRKRSAVENKETRAVASGSKMAENQNSNRSPCKTRVKSKVIKLKNDKETDEEVLPTPSKKKVQTQFHEDDEIVDMEIQGNITSDGEIDSDDEESNNSEGDDSVNEMTLRMKIQTRRLSHRSKIRLSHMMTPKLRRN